MALIRWDPFRDLTALQGEVNRLFSRATGGDVGDRQSWTPAIDVVETDDAIVLKAELAGMDPKDARTCSRIAAAWYIFAAVSISTAESAA